ncbi:MAG: molecular chaperone TorD family protein [Gammaproteobacteria bacterium]
MIHEPSDVNAGVRSRLYALLGEAFTYPQGSPVIRLLDGDLLADLNDALTMSPFALAEVPELINPQTRNAIQEMQITYTDLFDVASGTPKVSLLERRYGDNPEQKLWENLLSFYSHFGLDFSQGYAQEQPDHLLTELAFMHYLSFLEAGTSGDQDSFRRGQRDFLELHLGVWVKELSMNLSETKELKPYAVLGSLLADVVDSDLLYLEGRLESA